MAEVPQAEWAEVLEMARFYRSGQAGIRSAGQGFMVLVGLQEKLNEIAEDTGVDSDLLAAAVREAVDSAVTQSVVPALRSVVAEVLGADNGATADAIVDAVAARLARPA